MISTQIFTRSSPHPNSQLWDLLQPPYRIPICVVLGGDIQSNTDTFYIVNSQRAINLDSTGVAGVSPWNFRSRRGTMIVDNMFMTGRGTCTVNTADCDQFTPGNQGFLPVTILTKGAIVFEPNTALNVAGNGETGGPGGGGGGDLSDDGVFNSNTGLGQSRAAAMATPAVKGVLACLAEKGPAAILYLAMTAPPEGLV